MLNLLNVIQKVLENIIKFINGIYCLIELVYLVRLNWNKIIVFENCLFLFYIKLNLESL